MVPNLHIDIDEAVRRLHSSEVVAIPTETVYGLAASIRDEKAIRKIFTVKERPLFDPLIVHFSDLSQKSEVVSEWPKIADKLAAEFWPGPLTLVLPKNKNLNPLITASLETVGIRIPRHSVASSLLQKIQIPLAAPSANKFGKTSPTKAEHVQKEFEKQNIFILDGGTCEVGLESAVIKIFSEDYIQVLRPGVISREILSKVLGSKIKIDQKESIESPGHLESHYRPSKPLVIVESQHLDPRDVLRRLEKSLHIKSPRPHELRLDNDPLIAARMLYGEMRNLSEQDDNDVILVFKDRDKTSGVWEAIWNRLDRAAVLKI